MTTKPTPRLAVKPLPDPPEREPEDMTSYKHLAKTGSAHHLLQHLGNQETTIVEAERRLWPAPRSPVSGRLVPDLLIAFDADPEEYQRNNGYIISQQGKPPDFVLEIASPKTGRRDVDFKRPRYATMGVREYWRFDETGEYHGTRLAGDRLVNGRYEPIAIEEVGNGILQGYSAALNLIIRWENGQLRWIDPATGRHIPTFDDERERADAESARADAERSRADNERSRADNERSRAQAAEARIKELEAELAKGGHQDETPK